MIFSDEDARNSLRSDGRAGSLSQRRGQVEFNVQHAGEVADVTYFQFVQLVRDLSL